MAQPTTYTWPVVGSPPTIYVVRPLSTTLLSVIFSTDIVLNEALDLANYSMSGGVTVLGIVQVAGSLNSYTMTTSVMTAGVSYTLTASNIHDLSGTLI